MPFSRSVVHCCSLVIRFSLPLVSQRTRQKHNGGLALVDYLLACTGCMRNQIQSYAVFCMSRIVFDEGCVHVIYYLLLGQPLAIGGMSSAGGGPRVSRRKKNLTLETYIRTLLWVLLKRDAFTRSFSFQKE